MLLLLSYGYLILVPHDLRVNIIRVAVVKGLISKFYVCVACRRKITLVQIECSHCHTTGQLYYDKSRRDPLQCGGCKRDSTYFSCPHCQARNFYGRIKHKRTGLFLVVGIVLTTLATLVYLKLKLSF